MKTENKKILAKEIFIFLGFLSSIIVVGIIIYSWDFNQRKEYQRLGSEYMKAKIAVGYKGREVGIKYYDDYSSGFGGNFYKVDIGYDYENFKFPFLAHVITNIYDDIYEYLDIGVNKDWSELTEQNGFIDTIYYYNKENYNLSLEEFKILIIGSLEPTKELFKQTSNFKRVLTDFTTKRDNYKNHKYHGKENRIDPLIVTAKFALFLFILFYPVRGLVYAVRWAIKNYK